ncbi:MAG TPA: CusA/CzcA family heavy metal efflux RND transporter [Rhodocyclaceae bacterium]
MNRIVEFALKQRAFVLIMMLAVFAAGIVSFIKLNIEAYPDPVPPLVDIIAQSPGLSAEEMERYVTIPIEVQMAGIPNVKAIRTISLFGLSDIKLQFTYDFTYQQAEQWVTNRLAQLPPLPNGVQPQISPWSPIGEIFRYQLKGPPGYSVTDLKTLQDWVLERRFKAVPGVVDVNGWGGKTKTYEVSVDAAKLAANGLSLPQLLQALNNSNINVGGQTVEIGPQAAVVRGVGQINSPDDIRGTMLANNKGIPVTVGDVAAVSVGHQPRLGIAGHDDEDDVVEGIVLMRRGEQSMPTIERVKAEVDKINAGNVLPPGVRIERIYDRSDLIRATTHTVLHNMLFGVVLIFLLQWAFLGNLRSAVIVAATIPFALSFAIALMVLRGESANLLSVGAIDFGLVVDATVIMVENIFRHLAQHAMGHFEGDPVLHRLRAAVGLHGKFAVIANSATEVNRAIVFSAAIIIAGFLPLFTLSGIEGHIFGPMAKTYAYAIAGGLIATFTISPALSSYLLADHAKEEQETFVSRRLRDWYTPVVERALQRPRATLGIAAVLVLVALLAARSLGLEFLPKLEEGNLWIRATMPPSISLTEGDAYVNGMRALIKRYPEVETVVSQHGRPDDGTDATGFFNAEFFVPLKPADAWPAGVDKEKLTDDMTRALVARYPGVEFNFSQYIQDNVEEAASGVKGENSIKLFGSDLETLEKTAQQIKDVMKTVPGVTDLAVFNSLGQPTVRIDVDRARAARYGLMPGDINATIQAAIGGQAAGDLYEPGSDRHYPIMVRMAPEYRGSIEAIKRILLGVPNPNGGIVQVPLAEVAAVKLVSGASFIYREQQERYIPIKFSVRGRDLGSAVLEAQRKVAEQVKLPGGYRLEWVGEFGNLEEALSRLAVVVPLAIGLICLLLYANFGNLVDVALAASVIPMAMIGGVLALFVTGTPFSVSAAIGFVALFGIAAMDGIIVLSFFNQELDGGLSPYDAIRRTCQVQMRPVIMTCVVACVGLVPAAVSTGIGSQVQKPLALVVVGGIILAPVLILIVLPVLIDSFSRQARFAAQPPSGEHKE